MLGPPLITAATDARLQGSDIRLLLFLTLAPDPSLRLDPADAKPLKQFALARALTWDRKRVGRSLRRLARHGYLVRLPGEQSKTARYRLCWAMSHLCAHS